MTSAKWGEVILRERRLKLSTFYESNDPFELMLIDSRPQDTRKMVKIISDYYHKNVGMICFGARWSSPVMWAHYAEKHTGISLGFDVDDTLVVPVKYTDEKIEVPFGSHLPQFGLTQELLTQIVSTKAVDWEYEREYRVMGRFVTQDPNTGFYYTAFGQQIQLREVIIGCRCTWTARNISALIGAVDAPVRICKARPALGKFEMVEQKHFKRLTIPATKHRS